MSTDLPRGPAIRLVEVTRRYGDLVAVSRLSFEVNRGEVVGLLGPNGAGKTTALRMLATLIEPHEGSLEVDGIEVRSAPLAVRKRLGYQTGDTGLYDRLTPREFLRYFGRLQEIPETLLEEQIARLIPEFGIEEFADRFCGTLSTGQKQRVSLARTFVHDPPVLVLDEPTAGLDIVSSAFILDTLRAAADAGRAVLFSTHVLSEIELICDRVLIINRGELIATGTLDELLAATGQSQLSRAFLRLIDAHEPGGARADASEAGTSA